MIYVSPALVLAPINQDANAGRIGYHSILTADNVSATSEVTGFPASNLANPATYPLVYWKSNSTDLQQIVVAEAAENIDYFGIAKHNLGTSGATVLLRGSNDGGDTWTDITIEVQPGSDDVLVINFAPVSYSYWSLLIQPGDAAPFIGVLYIGRMLVLERNIYVGHKPLVYGRHKTVLTGMSEGGQFMGRTARREFLAGGVALQNLTPGWFRASLDPFLDECQAGKPFFWAWRPGSYPLEVAYAWITGTPELSNQSPNGLMQASWDMQGIR